MLTSCPPSLMQCWSLLWLGSCSSTFQILAVESPDPDARRSLFGFQAHENTSDSWPFRMDTLPGGMTTGSCCAMNGGTIAWLVVGPEVSMAWDVSDLAGAFDELDEPSMELELGVAELLSFSGSDFGFNYITASIYIQKYAKSHWIHASIRF